MAEIQIPFKAYAGEEPYIFVSYAHVNKALVFPLIRQLHEKGYRLWYDEGIDPGTEWPDMIEAHLGKSVSMLLFITPQSVASENVKDEIHYAIDEKIPIVPVFLEETELIGGLKLRLRRYQWVHYFTWPDDKAFFEALERSPHLKGCLGQRAVDGNAGRLEQEEEFCHFHVGDTVNMGGFDWLVISTNKEGDTATVLSKSIVTNHFFSSRNGVLWEDCELRYYLNSVFYNRFNETEKSMIVEATVENYSDPSEAILGGKTTKDKVFVLNFDEAESLSKSLRSASQNWYLRSVGRSGVKIVTADGRIIPTGAFIDSNNNGGVRPAMSIRHVLTPGDTIQFGHYQWKVLDIQNGKALLVTNDVISRQEFSSDVNCKTWEKSSLRNYLNGAFYHSFTQVEQGKIVESDIVTDDNPDDYVDSYRLKSYHSADKIFLLSNDEAVAYWVLAKERIAQFGKQNASWWLRSPGNHSHAMVIEKNGVINDTGRNVMDRNCGVRPALWLRTD